MAEHVFETFALLSDVVSVFPRVDFFFNDPATTEIYTLSLHDALPIWPSPAIAACPRSSSTIPVRSARRASATRSEEHTSELQSPDHLVCRLLLEKKNNRTRREILPGLQPRR